MARFRPKLWRDHFFSFSTITYHRMPRRLTQLLAKKMIPLLNHPPYSPDLCPPDLLNINLKGNLFPSIDEVQATVTTTLNCIPKRSFWKVWKGWKIVTTFVLLLIETILNKKNCWKKCLLWIFYTSSLKTFGTHRVFICFHWSL